jgi:hypothetical protein
MPCKWCRLVRRGRGLNEKTADTVPETLGGKVKTLGRQPLSAHCVGSVGERQRRPEIGVLSEVYMGIARIVSMDKGIPYVSEQQKASILKGLLSCVLVSRTATCSRAL